MTVDTEDRVTEDQEKRPRGTREATTTAILDAAEDLFAQRGYTAVTIREIAASAGVSHALVHRYLGTKDDVYRAMLVRRETVIHDAAPDEDDLLLATRLMLAEALHQRRYLRLIMHSALHGLPYSRTSGRFAATERLVQLAEEAAAREPDRDPDALDPRFVIASFVAMLLGWNAGRDWLLPATGLDGMSDDEFVAALERVILDLERLYFPAAGAAGTD
jgi:TetR/AcrR family transcriptional regulator, repressor for neighboring sulfatase